ncbi:hypothetical protein Pelo_408 [Pelomyxa schiedti]|nr:hypothetical protein Pelo_408 [Pelomyxa schiedti]
MSGSGGTSHHRSGGRSSGADVPSSSSLKSSGSSSSSSLRASNTSTSPSPSGTKGRATTTGDPSTAVSSSPELIFGAAKRGNINLINECISSLGSKVVTATDTLKNTPLHYSASGGHSEAASLILEHGADVDAKNFQGETALHKAVWADHIDVARLLIHAGASLTATNTHTQKPSDLTKSKAMFDLFTMASAASKVSLDECTNDQDDDE